MSSKEVALWALRTGRIQVEDTDVAKVIANRMADAWRKEEITDKQGRVVRNKHAAPISRIDDEGKESQEFVWDNLETISYEHAVLSFSNRRGGIRDDVERLRDDSASYNDNHRPKSRPRIQMNFNFEADEDEDAGAA